MLPSDVVRRLLVESDIIGLKFMVGAEIVNRHLRVKTVEGPNNLRDFSLGAAAAQAAAGTGWLTIQEGTNFILEPVNGGVLYQVFYGIAPSYAWVYRAYPSNVIRGSLHSTLTLGDRTNRIGYVDGIVSPYNSPSPETEFFVVEGDHPAFYGYHPRTEPGSITVRMNFFILRYGVDWLKQPTVEEVARSKIRTMGGETLMSAPQWLRGD